MSGINFFYLPFITWCKIISMKKIAIIALVLFGSILFFTSCQSHGPKCPGMYSQIETPNQAKPQ